MAAATWEEARTWLSECGVIKAEEAGTLLQFASVLQNGAVLCSLINKVSPNLITATHSAPKLQVRHNGS